MVDIACWSPAIKTKREWAVRHDSEMELDEYALATTLFARLENK
jgi:hypothetical protein